MAKKQTAMIVDDEQGSIVALEWVLKDEFNVISFTNPKVALNLIKKNTQMVDIIFLDLLMDSINGLQFLNNVKEVSKQIEVVIVSASRNKDLIMTAMRAGAFDCIEKPFSVAEILNTAKMARERRIENTSAEKIKSVMENSANVFDYNNMDAMISLFYAGDNNTFEHSSRVSKMFVRVLSLYAGKVDDGVIRSAELVSSLHDIGKIGIKDSILKKKSALTKKEYDEVKRHPVVGYNILKNVDALDVNLDMVLHHQERFDGKGYPEGLKGEEISLFSRLLSIVDAYDAMSDSRPYRKGMDRESAVKELKKNSGTQFDPGLVDFFVDNMYNLKV